MEWAQNHVLSNHAFKLRPMLMHIRFFGRFTNSNAESEHSAIKGCSLPLKPNLPLSTAYQRIDMNAKRRQCIKKQQEHSDLNKTDSKSLCLLSNHVTKPCFEDVTKLVEAAKHCISKQLDNITWKVIYQRCTDHFDKTGINAFLPYIKRIRTVTKSSEGQLKCSCKYYERHGYPCQHLFHVLKCYETKDVQKEWIHIRWTKAYSKYQYSETSTVQQRRMYQKLYDDFPIGPYHISTMPTSTYPIFSAFNESLIREISFDCPSYQLMSRTQVTVKWSYVHKTTDEQLNRILGQADDNLLDGHVFQSETNHQLSQEAYNEDESASPNYDNHDDEHNSNYTDYDSAFRNAYPEPLDFNAHNALLKRIYALCGKDKEANRRYYDLSANFLNSMEINHKDNAKILKKRNLDFEENNLSDEPRHTIVSSSKIVNTQSRSNKRPKYSYEKK